MCELSAEEDAFTAEILRKRKVRIEKSKFHEKAIRLSVADILSHCGEVCNTRVTGKPGKFYDVIEKDVDCKQLFKSPDLYEDPVYDEPPRGIPKFLVSDFSYDGRVDMNTLWYVNDADGSHTEHVWPAESIDRRVRTGAFDGSYGADDTASIWRALTGPHMNLTAARVLVLGSQEPWLEAMALRAGADHVTTVDYAPLVSRHPQVTTLTPDALAAAFLAASEDGGLRFDAAITFSSLEHSGLGRYGDVLNPWGDLMTMARLWCVVRPGGKALVGVPTGPDQLFYNANRVYGPLQYSHLMANWKQVYSGVDSQERFQHCQYCASYQPLHVLEK
jgi:hypothetical protein